MNFLKYNNMHEATVGAAAAVAAAPFSRARWRMHVKRVSQLQ